MKKELPKNRQGWPAARQGGFLQIIFIIIVLLLIMKFLGITVSGLWYWFTSFFRDVLR